MVFGGFYGRSISAARKQSRKQALKLQYGGPERHLELSCACDFPERLQFRTSINLL